MPKLIALISKKSSISEEDFKTYYENNHAPLIESLFPTLNGYTRTYLFESNLLSDLSNDCELEQLVGLTEKLDIEDHEYKDMLIKQAKLMAKFEDKYLTVKWNKLE